MTQPDLRACPTCSQTLTQADLGMRDYSRWLNPILPGKLGGTDIDCVLDQASTGRMLMFEFKEGNKPLGVGQRLLFTALKKRNIDVWVVWGPYDDGHVKVGEMDTTGQVRFTEDMPPAKLGAKVKAWWYDGLTTQ